MLAQKTRTRRSGKRNRLAIFSRKFILPCGDNLVTFHSQAGGALPRFVEVFPNPQARIAIMGRGDADALVGATFASLAFDPDSGKIVIDPATTQTFAPGLETQANSPMMTEAQPGDLDAVVSAAWRLTLAFRDFAPQYFDKRPFSLPAVCFGYSQPLPMVPSQQLARLTRRYYGLFSWGAEVTPEQMRYVWDSVICVHRDSQHLYPVELLGTAPATPDSVCLEFAGNSRGLATMNRTFQFLVAEGRIPEDVDLAKWRQSPSMRHELIKSLEAMDGTRLDAIVGRFKGRFTGRYSDGLPVDVADMCTAIENPNACLVAGDLPRSQPFHGPQFVQTHGAWQFTLPVPLLMRTF